MRVPPSDPALLHALCRSLTGVAFIPDRMVEATATFVRDQFDGDTLESLLAAFATDGLAGMAAHRRADVARAMCYFLYLGVPVDERGAVTARPIEVKDYFESLLPRVIQAHPRGLSGGYFGHWHYPPEDSP